MRPPALQLAVLALFGVAVLGATPVAAADNGGNVSLYQVPDGVDDGVALERAVGNGSADRAEKLALGDAIGIAIESERLADDLASRNGSTTERFFAALDDEADLRIVQTNPTPERSTKRTHLGPANTTVHRNGSTLYVLVDLENLTFERSGDTPDPEPLRDGEAYAVTFGYGLDELAADGPEVELFTTPAEFTTVSTYTYVPLPPERVNRSVRVNIDPDDRLFVRTRLDSGENVTAPVESVEWLSSPGVSLDLRDLDPGTGYELTLVHDGDVVDRYDGTIRTPEATMRNVTVVDGGDGVVVNATVTLSHGGEVRAFDGDGERLVRRRVPPGTETRVSVGLDGSVEELVLRAAREEGASEEFYADARRTLDLGDQPGATPTVTETTATKSDTERSPAEDQTGFGVGVAVAALSATLLARRRRQ